MEADLSELAAESGGDLIGRLGSPKLYAAELRSAAGMPELVAGSAPRRRPLADALTHARSSSTMLTEQHPWLRSVRTFLVTLRPAWWLIRGYLAAWTLWSMAGGMRGLRPHGVLELAMAIGAIVVSVRLGQGWLRHLAMTRPLLVLGNTIAVVVALVASTAGVTSGELNYVSDGSFQLPGVALDGQQVSNIYAYDSAGNRITGVRLFAQDGRPLNGAHSSVDSNGSPIGLDVDGNPMAVVRDSSGAPRLNVYPNLLFGPDPWQVTDPANPQESLPPWTPPVSINPLIPNSSATSTATAIPTPAPTPTNPVEPTPAATITTPGPASAAKPKPAKPTSTPPSGQSPSVTRSAG